MERRTEFRPLIDKITLNNLDVLDIEPIRVMALIKAGILTVRKDADNARFTRSGLFYHSISISQATAFDQFAVGESFCSLQLSVSDDEYHNLHCLTIDEYRARLMAAKECLRDEYGITIDISDAKIRTIEINSTIIINDEFKRYLRAVSLMMANHPGQLRLKTGIDYYDCRKQSAPNMRDVSTIMRSSGKNGLTIKAYDKTRQLNAEYGITMSDNYFRYEIRLNTSQKVKRSLGTSRFWEVSQNDIEKYYNTFIADNIVQPYEDYCRRRDIVIRRILKKQYKTASRTWVRDVLLQLYNEEIDNGLPVVLSINEVFRQLEAVRFKTRQAKYKAKLQFESVCTNVASVLANGDDQKYTELVEKLSGT